MQLYEPGVNDSKALGEYIASRRFRQPLAFILFGGISVEVNIAWAAGHVPKRLPLQAMGDRRAMTRTGFYEQEDDWRRIHRNALLKKPFRQNRPVC